MIVNRRGLSVRSVGNDYLKKETLGKETRKESVGKEPIAAFRNKENDDNVNKEALVKQKNTACLSIFKETSSSVCQHCGAARLALKSPQQSHASTQAPDGIAKELEMLCCEEPPVEYWKELAESRRLALVESLAENEEVRFAVL
ncbi:unnamed protein product [Mesocestoides corti]|uniref:Geminin n=1 Tax=Mesocestoides corti TaxID=53468 RepID=A0A0R3U9Z1_MESCO|nr:unnamed protein product [Mesocestoides corti]